MIRFVRRAFGITKGILNRNEKKQKEDFKQQIRQLATKPTFTMKDYRRRVSQNISKSKKGLKSMISQNNNQNIESLQNQLKVMNGMFQYQLKGNKKQQIARVAEVSTRDINHTLKKFQNYSKVWKLVRSLKQNNQPLPEQYQQLRSLMLQNRGKLTSFQERRRTYWKKKQQMPRRDKIRLLKWGKYSMIK